MRRYALVIGINDYTHSPLSHCVNDAEEVGAILEEPEYGFEVTYLLDNLATRKNVYRQLDSILKDDPEYLVFYFAGHGYADEVGTYLATIDTDDVDIGASIERISGLINTKLSSSAPALVILDCCHSGAASIRDLTISPVVPNRHLRPSDIQNSRATLSRGRVLIAACKPDEVAYEEPSLRHGIFTHYLLEGLYGDAVNSTGEVTASQLYEYVAKRFKEGTGQTPVFRGDMIGTIVVGTNLTPRERSILPEEKLNELESVATQLITENYQIRTSNINLWQSDLYKEACSALLPTIDWFEKHLDQYPTLVRRPKFELAHSMMKGRLIELARIEKGMNTREGVAVSRLGSGTFGVVWKMQSDDGRELAYKVYHPIDMENPEKLSRFNRGYRAMDRLDHAHIVRVHRFTRCPIGFTMDFINGPNLRDFAASRRVPSEIVSQLLVVGETLHHSHSRNVIHRDVKPENIIMGFDEISQNYRPYLTDFDLAWFSTATQFTQEALGSFVYAAPEQLAKPNSKHAHAATTDIYAFGQLCFFFLTRRDPVALLADNSRALSDELREGWLEKPARLLLDLYKDCNEDNPSRRVQDFREVCDRLFEINALIQERDHLKIITFGEFCRQLIFSIVGTTPERIISETCFRSASGRTMVEISESSTYSNRGILFTFEGQQTLLIEGASSFHEARSIINSRLDVALNEFPNIHRKTGSQGIFETLIYVDGISLNIDGVETCRRIVMRTMEATER